VHTVLMKKENYLSLCSFS